MQDIHSIAGANRLFSGGGGGGDRRLRPHLHHHQSNHQALKCPRCDSLNTKFCYYNNYNLSQPRHFCKSCRRYWTKGGVLRNVPVGGGCRKTKRSSKSKPSPESATPPPLPEHKSNSHSSSESSSLTATTTATASAAVLTEEVSGQTGNQNFESDPPMMEQGIFSEIGSFTSLITSTTETLPFGFNNIADVTPFTLNQQGNHHHHHHQFQAQWNQPQRIQEMTLTSGFMDQTAQIDPNRSSNVGFGSLDWQTNGDGEGEGDQGLFDLPHTVDQAYWSQNQWTDPIQDQPNLYLP